MSKSRALTEKDLKAIADKAVRQTREALFIGSVNVTQDFVKTGGWAYNLLSYVRVTPRWIKGNELKQTQDEQRHVRWRREQTKVNQFRWVPDVEQKVKPPDKTRKKWLSIDPPQTEAVVERFRDDAIHAASACHYKLGNCREMASVTAYYLFQHFMTPELKKLVEDQQIQISIVQSKTFGHEFIKLTAKVKNADGQEKEETLFIDPWMGLESSFTLSEFENYKKKITDKLLQEEIAIINRTTPSVSAAKAKIEILQKRYKDNMPYFTPGSFTTNLQTNSTFMFSHYINAFDAKLLELNIGQKAIYFANELLSAIKAGSPSRVSTYIDNVPYFTPEIIEAAAKSDNLEIATRIEKKLLERSKFYLGDITLLDLDKIEKNSICLVKENDNFIWLQKDNDNHIIRHPIEFQKDGLKINDIHIPINQFNDFDNALLAASQEQIISVTTAQDMITWHEHLSALRQNAEEAKQDLLLFALEKQDLYAAEKIITNIGIREPIEGLNLNLEATNSHGETALFLALKLRSNTIVKALMGKKVNLTQEDKYGISPIILATVNNFPSVIDEIYETNYILINKPAAIHENKTPLHFAVEYNAIAALNQLLSYEDIKINAIDLKGRTPLHIAVIFNNVDAVKLLLQKKADWRIQDSAGKSALDYSNNPEITALIQQYITPDLPISPIETSPHPSLDSRPIEPSHPPLAVAENKMLTLHDAVRTGNMSLFEEKAQRIADLDSLDEYGKTPLCYALDNKLIDMAKELIKRGARLDFIDEEGSTYFHMAAKTGMVDLLLDSFKNNIDIQDANMRTALQLCIANNHSLNAEVLLSQGADPNIQDITGKTAAHIAMEYANDETLLVLLNNQNVRLDILDNTGKTPFDHCDPKRIFILALKFGREDILDKLLQYKTSHPLQEDTLLCDLISQKKEEYALLLIKHGVINLTKPEGKLSPLELAIQTGQPNIIKALLQKGAKYTNALPVNELMSPNTYDLKLYEVANSLLEGKAELSQQDSSSGCTILHVAIYENEINLIRAIATHQAALLKQTDNYGNTPIHYAILMSKPIDTLISLGVDLNKKNNEDKTALELALENNQAETACKLMMHGADIEELKTDTITLSRTELIAEAKTYLSTISDDETRLRLLKNFLTSEDHIRPIFSDKERDLPELHEWHQELERSTQLKSHL
ncbi:MAG: ankyrin repeat domain-containing protein [Gammaproteobacteria bacterium]